MRLGQFIPILFTATKSALRLIRHFRNELRCVTRGIFNGRYQGRFLQILFHHMPPTRRSARGSEENTRHLGFASPRGAARSCSAMRSRRASATNAPFRRKLGASGSRMLGQPRRLAGFPTCSPRLFRSAGFQAFELHLKSHRRRREARGEGFRRGAVARDVGFDRGATCPFTRPVSSHRHKTCLQRSPSRKCELVRKWAASSPRPHESPAPPRAEAGVIAFSQAECLAHAQGRI
jgi:hypothetical protein